MFVAFRGNLPRFPLVHRPGRRKSVLSFHLPSHTHRDRSATVLSVDRVLVKIEWKLNTCCLLCGCHFAVVAGVSSLVIGSAPIVGCVCCALKCFHGLHDIDTVFFFSLVQHVRRHERPPHTSRKGANGQRSHRAISIAHHTRSDKKNIHTTGKRDNGALSHMFAPFSGLKWRLFFLLVLLFACHSDANNRCFGKFALFKQKALANTQPQKPIPVPAFWKVLFGFFYTFLCLLV